VQEANLEDKFALQTLAADGNIAPTLGCYCDLMIQRDTTPTELTDTSEANHKDSFYFCLKLNYYLLLRVEFEDNKAFFSIESRGVDT
jgi:hypothetical protein